MMIVTQDGESDEDNCTESDDEDEHDEDVDAGGPGAMDTRKVAVWNPCSHSHSVVLV